MQVPAYVLLIELQRRGFRVTTDDDGMTLVVAPHERLTREDCFNIRRWKTDLLTLLTHGEQPTMAQLS